MARDDPEVQLLMTIPGIGYYIALLVKAEVGDIKRFTGGDHLVSYAGLIPAPGAAAGSPGMAGSSGRVAGGSGGRWWRRLSFMCGGTPL